MTKIRPSPPPLPVLFRVLVMVMRGAVTGRSGGKGGKRNTSHFCIKMELNITDSIGRRHIIAL
jgi:hypothetical protein